MSQDEERRVYRPKKLTLVGKSGALTYGPFPMLLMQNTDLNPAAKQLWVYLHFRQRKNDTAWPSQDTICLHTNLSRSTVSRSIKSLEALGWLRVSRTRNGGVRHNSYVTCTPREPIIVENDKSNSHIGLEENETSNSSKRHQQWSQNEAIKEPLKTLQKKSLKNTIHAESRTHVASVDIDKEIEEFARRFASNEY